MKRILAALAISVGSVLAAEDLGAIYTPHGQLIVTQFVSAPFPHTARNEGHTYKEKVYPAKEHYSDSSVTIFIPKGFRETSKVDVVVYFHGWFSTVPRSLSIFKLVEQFVDGNKNAILVVPEGPHMAPDSFGGKLEDAGGFKKFIEELTATLKSRKIFKNADFSIGNVILSGHSGGYRVMSAIVDRGGLSSNVKEVWILDGLYAETEKFLAWSDREQGRLVNIYTDGGGTKDDSETMMELLKKRGTPFLAVEETKVTQAELKANKLVFIHTELGHNDVVAKRNQFALFLKTSSLSDLKSTP